MVSFFVRRIFRENLNEAILSVKINIIFKMTSILANEISSFSFLWNNSP